MNVELLKKLSEAFGVSGYEGEVREIIRKELEGSVNEIEMDNLGNLIALKKGEGGKSKIALFAHMDEPGLFVKHVDDKGFVYPAETSSIDPEILLGQEVLIKTKEGYINGIVGYKPVHLQTEEEAKKKIEYKNIFIDVGAKDKKEAEELGIEPGMPISFKQNFSEFGKNFIKGKALDNRISCYILLQLAKELKLPNDLYFVFSVQEEVGLKGAKVSAYKLNPDFALVFDVSPAGGTPGIEEKECSIFLGKGPTITAIEASGRGVIIPEDVKNGIVEVARKEKIPYQIEAIAGGMSDATIVQLTREGIRVGGIGVPCRYIHSPIEIASREDLENAIKLAKAFLEGLE